jgi:hypothetical protein
MSAGVCPCDTRVLATNTHAQDCEFQIEGELFASAADPSWGEGESPRRVAVSPPRHNYHRQNPGLAEIYPRVLRWRRGYLRRGGAGISGGADTAGAPTGTAHDQTRPALMPCVTPPIPTGANVRLRNWRTFADAPRGLAERAGMPRGRTQMEAFEQQEQEFEDDAALFTHANPELQPPELSGLRDPVNNFVTRPSRRPAGISPRFWLSEGAINWVRAGLGSCPQHCGGQWPAGRAARGARTDSSAPSVVGDDAVTTREASW